MNPKKARILTQDFLNGSLTYENISVLRELIHFHNYQYRVLNAPVIDDTMYDKLFILLEKRENVGGIDIPSDSPTQLVGEELIHDFQKLEHAVPMLSLQNTYSSNEIIEWSKRFVKIIYNNKNTDGIADFQYLIEPKLDGSSIQLVYKYGVLYAAATRGNGYVGEDITTHAQKISNLPHSISQRKNEEEVVLRAEVVMPQEAFERINNYLASVGGQLFANARNAASGTLRNLDSSLVYKRGLQCYVFEVLSGMQGFRYDSGSIEQLRELGFPVHPWIRVINSIEEVVRVCESQEVRKQTQYGSIACDGLVVKLDDYALRDVLGFTQHHPRRAIAYKYPAQEVVAYLQKIEWQVGRTGIVTPVAHLRPVEVGGVSVQRATLHNASFILERKLFSGCEIWIKRSGEVIPYVIGRVGNDEIDDFELTYPDHCPVCDHTLIMSEDFKRLVCINIHCAAQQKERLKHFVSRDAASIEGMGGRMIELFYDNGLISTLESLYLLDSPSNKQVAMTLEGVGELKRSQIIESIEGSKKRGFSEILFGLGIIGVGKKLAKSLSQFYAATLDDDAKSLSLYEYLCKKNTEAQLCEVYGIGTEVSNTIVQRSQRVETKVLLDALERFGVLTLEKLSTIEHNKFLATGSFLAGKTIVITGSFPLGRKVLEDQIEQLGGMVRSSLSSSTDFLVVGENPGSKFEKAKKLGTTILGIESILSSVGDNPKLSRNSLESNQQQSLFN